MLLLYPYSSKLKIHLFFLHRKTTQKTRLFTFTFFFTFFLFTLFLFVLIHKLLLLVPLSILSVPVSCSNSGRGIIQEFLFFLFTLNNFGV